MAPEIICPLPHKWSVIYKSLLETWKNNKTLPEPPRPLILAGWAGSDDTDKKIRWDETVDWINRYANPRMLERLTPDDFYQVAERSSYIEFQYYDFETKNRQSEDAVQRAIGLLKEQWLQIVGEELGKMTEPIEISGRKSRRLVVRADFSCEPPWGTWTSIDRNKQVIFRQFRRAVNKAISPVEVDHIDFIALGIGSSLR